MKVDEFEAILSQHCNDDEQCIIVKMHELMQNCFESLPDNSNEKGIMIYLNGTYWMFQISVNNKSDLWVKYEANQDWFKIDQVNIKFTDKCLLIDNSNDKYGQEIIPIDVPDKSWLAITRSKAVALLSDLNCHYVPFCDFDTIKYYFNLYLKRKIKASINQIKSSNFEQYITSVPCKTPVSKLIIKYDSDDIDTIECPPGLQWDKFYLHLFGKNVDLEYTQTGHKTYIKIQTAVIESEWFK